MKEYEELKKELREIAKILKEYPENLQANVFELLSKNYLGEITIDESKQTFNKPKADNKKSITEPKKSEKANTSSPTSKKRNTSTKDSYKIVKTLNLKGDSSTPSLQKFCEDKIISSSIKFNVVAAYYLKKVLKVENVTPDHIYSCYKEMSKKLPTRLLQSLRDTAGSKYGYLDTSDTNNIKVPVTGENFVEHDLIKKPKK